MYQRIMVAIGDSFAQSRVLASAIGVADCFSSPVADGEKNLGRDGQRLVQKASCSLLRVRSGDVL